MRQRQQNDARAQATVNRWAQQRARLRALHQDLLHAPVPDALLQAASHTAREPAQRTQRRAFWWRRGGMPASVLAAFALGWTGHGHWSPGHADPRSAGTALAPAQRFAQQAAAAHAVYQPEVRHPVEVTAAQQQHLVQWLSKRLQRPLTVPAPGAHGYGLVGGRLLPGDSGARAQFMYESAQGQRITLYLGALPSGAAGRPAPAPATAFQFTQDGPVPAFYWVDQDFGYALSGQLPRAGLLKLATTVYQELQRP